MRAASEAPLTLLSLFVNGGSRGNSKPKDINVQDTVVQLKGRAAHVAIIQLLKFYEIALTGLNFVISGGDAAAVCR